jgi:hypothetical protein
VAEFDPSKVLLSVLQLLTDTKEKVKNVAIETFVVYSSLFVVKADLETYVSQMVDEYTYDILTNRLEAGMVPYIDNEGALVMPYIDNYEASSIMINDSSMVLPNLSRRDSSTHSASISH